MKVCSLINIVIYNHKIKAFIQIQNQSKFAPNIQSLRKNEPKTEMEWKENEEARGVEAGQEESLAIIFLVFQGVGEVAAHKYQSSHMGLCTGEDVLVHKEQEAPSI